MKRHSRQKYTRFRINLRWSWAVCFFISLFFFHHTVRAQQQEIKKVPSSFVVTMDSTFRAAEGDLLLGINSVEETIRPFVWRVPKAGLITCVTTSQGCRYLLEFQEQSIQPESKSVKVGILSVTVSNLISNDVQVSFWSAWRPSRLNRGQPYGISLDEEVLPKSPWIPDPFQWTPTASWYFREKSFMRNQEIIYYTAYAEGWKQERFVRDIQLPYHDLHPKSVLGYTHFYQTLEGGNELALQFFIPFHPLPYQEIDFLNSLQPAN